MSEEWETEEGENRQKQGDGGGGEKLLFSVNGGGREMKSWRPTLDFV